MHIEIKIISLKCVLQVQSQRVAFETLTRLTYIEELASLSSCKITPHMVIYHNGHAMTKILDDEYLFNLFDLFQMVTAD